SYLRIGRYTKLRWNQLRIVWHGCEIRGLGLECFARRDKVLCGANSARNLQVLVVSPSECDIACETCLALRHCERTRRASPAEPPQQQTLGRRLFPGFPGPIVAVKSTKSYIQGGPNVSTLH